MADRGGGKCPETSLCKVSVRDCEVSFHEVHEPGVPCCKLPAKIHSNIGDPNGKYGDVRVPKEKAEDVWFAGLCLARHQEPGYLGLAVIASQVGCLAECGRADAPPDALLNRAGSVVTEHSAHLRYNAVHTCARMPSVK